MSFIPQINLMQRVAAGMFLKGIGSVARGYDIAQTNNKELMKRLVARESVTLGVVGASTLGLEMAFAAAKPFLKSLPMWQANKTWLKLAPLAGAYISAEAIGRKFSGFGSALQELSQKASKPATTLEAATKAVKSTLGFTGTQFNTNPQMASFANYQNNPQYSVTPNFSQYA